MKKKQMKLGLSIRYLGYHMCAWRHPEVPADGASDFRVFLKIAQAAEHHKIDLVFLADGIGIRYNDEPPGSLCRSGQNAELEPITLLAALAPLTNQIGLVATASTTYNEPYHIARKFGSLDQISGGRSGWNVVTSWSNQEAWNFNRAQHLEYDTRYERAEEFVDVVTGLWDSWDKDAFIYDKSSGIFYDQSKLHTLTHVGKHFSVRGPLSVRRSPQGRPILVQAGTSTVGQEIAARHCELIFAAQRDLPSAQKYYASVKGRLEKHGRNRDDLVILPGITAIVGRTQKEAEAKYKALQDLIDPRVGLSFLYGTFGDLSGYPLDGPVPKPDLENAKIRSTAQLHWELAEREGLTIRQLYQKVGMSQVHWTVVGTPKEIVDQMEHWVDSDGADGFNITPTHLPGAFDDFAEMILPELRRRGRFREEYEGSTLRENLGVPTPESRYANACD